MTAKNYQSNLGRSQVHSLVQALKPQILGFTVFSSTGERLGVVQDLTVDSNDQICLVLSQEGQPGYQSYWVSSESWKRIDSARRVVEVDLTAGQPMSGASLGVEGTAMPVDAAFDSSRLEDQAIVRLVEERLKVNRQKRKVGEVIVRKAVETRIVEVPVRREKLIIEQISPERQQLAAIDLGQGEITGIDVLDPLATEQRASTSPYRVEGRFDSPQVACQVLSAIAKNADHQCSKIMANLGWKAGASSYQTYHEFPEPAVAYQVLNTMVMQHPTQVGTLALTLDLQNAEAQERYQTWFSRYSK